MADAAAQKILDAIREFEDEHGSDPKYRGIYQKLADAEKALSDVGSAQEKEDSPGRRAAREAAPEAETPKEEASPSEEPDKKPNPFAKKDDTEGEGPPKTFADAKKRAFKQYQKA